MSKIDGQRRNGVIHINSDLVGCFEPEADFLGLDALHLDIQALAFDIYLPLILRAYEGG